jgi:hypothetical protein
MVTMAYLFGPYLFYPGAPLNSCTTTLYPGKLSSRQDTRLNEGL